MNKMLLKKILNNGQYNMRNNSKINMKGLIGSKFLRKIN